MRILLGWTVVMFWNDLEQFGDRPALIDHTGTTIDYATLAALADGAGFGDHLRGLVLMEMSNDAPSLIAYLGALRAGHAVILTNAGKADALTALADRYRPDLQWRTDGGIVRQATASIQPLHDELAIMLSTSGSTGSAKLVKLSAGAVEANARSIADYLGIVADDRAITSLPPAYSYGLSVINSHLASGAAIILTDLSVSEPGFAQLMARERATSMAGVPYTYELIEASGLLEALPASMRTLTQAGGRLAPERIERVRLAAERQGVRFFVMYGQTEATARMAYVPPEQLARFPDCIGQPIPGGRFELCDPDSGAPTEQAGELVYHGANIMMGYAESRDDLRHGSQLDRLVTGDLAELAAPGIYRITGRKSRFLKIFGLRLALDEIEHEALRRGWTAAATGDDTRVVVAVAGDGDHEALALGLAKRFGLPASRLVTVPFAAIPRLANGKVDFPAIAAAAPTPAAGIDPGQDPLEAYATLLARLARKPQVDEQTSFAAVGGDSLNYIEASILLEQTFGDVPPGWESMSLHQLGELAGSIDDLTRPMVKPSLDTRYIQILRSIAIILVVMAHTATVFVVSTTAANNDPISYFPLRHVNAVFIVVAGFLFQYLLNGFEYRSYLRVKAQTVILPYLIISIPAIILYLIGFKDPASLDAPGWVQGRVGLTVYMLLTGTHLGPLWFIPMIVLIYLLAPLFRAIDARPVLYWAAPLLLVLSYFVGRSADDSNPVQALIFYLPAYLIGMAACRYRNRLMPVLARWWPLLLLAIFIPDALALKSSPYEAVTLLSKVIFCFGLLGGVARIAKRVPRWFDHIGEMSFGIYFVHGYVVGVLLILVKKLHLALHGFAEFAVASLGVVAVSVLAVMAVKLVFGGRSRWIIGA
ncbi:MULTISPECIES: AMP-binding protein [unclassified Sphingomonas]|uniref:AMP-binding protein n=1 Tax=unclassified Sphingomonas TaxID=196159 RepID=UPI00226B8374|nr:MULTISPECIES: AMP-binding protein [unclassified Sphingomonas]